MKKFFLLFLFSFIFLSVTAQNRLTVTINEDTHIRHMTNGVLFECYFEKQSVYKFTTESGVRYYETDCYFVMKRNGVEFHRELTYGYLASVRKGSPIHVEMNHIPTLYVLPQGWFMVAYHTDGDNGANLYFLNPYANIGWTKKLFDGVSEEQRQGNYVSPIRNRDTGEITYKPFISERNLRGFGDVTMDNNMNIQFNIRWNPPNLTDGYKFSRLTFDLSTGILLKFENY